MHAHYRHMPLITMIGVVALLMSQAGDPGHVPTPEESDAAHERDTPNPLTDGAAAIDPVNVDPDAAGEPADPVEHDKAPADGGQPEAGQPTEG